MKKLELIAKSVKELNVKNVLKKLADIINEHWIWKVVILFIPSIYMPIVIKYVGEKCGLTDNNGSLTSLGWGITIAVYISALFVNILSSYKAKRDKENELERRKLLKSIEDSHKEEIEVYRTNLGIYGTLLHVIGNVCDTKFDSILSYIDNSIMKGQFSKPFNETVHPDRQLKNIAKEMKKCISEVTETPIDNITISMAIEFPEINKTTKWVDQSETMQCMKLDKLKKNDKTTFHQVYSGKSEYVFYNDKLKAAEENKYVLDNKDHRYNDVGSILCEDICIEEDNSTLARIILSISTYGYKFTNSEDDEVLNNISDVIKEVILHQFDKRIKIELSLLYIKKKYNNI